MLKKVIIALFCVGLVFSCSESSDPNSDSSSSDTSGQTSAPTVHYLNVTIVPPSDYNKPLVFKFSQDMKPILPGQEEGVQIRFGRYVSGSYKWIDSKTLHFVPSGVSWPSYYKSRVTVVGGAKPAVVDETHKPMRTDVKNEITIKNTDSRPNYKHIGWTPDEGYPRFVTFLHYLGQKYEFGRKPLYLLFDQKITPEDIQDSLIVKHSSGIEVEYTLTMGDDAVERFGVELDTSRILKITPVLKNESYDITDGDLKVTFRDQYLKKEVDEDTEGAIMLLDYRQREKYYLFTPNIETYEIPIVLDFTVLAISNYQLDKGLKHVPQQTTIHLNMSNGCYGDDLREHVKITPEPPYYRLGYVRGKMFALDLKLDPGTEYTLSFTSGFESSIGNTFEAPEDFIFSSLDYTPRLDLPFRSLLIESDKKEIPMRVRNVNTATAKVFRYEAAKGYAGNHAEMFSDSSMRVNQFDLSRWAATEKTINLDYSNIDLNELSADPLDVSDFEPGLYFIKWYTDDVQGNQNRTYYQDYQYFQISNLGITSKLSKTDAFVWVTELSTGKPVADAEVWIQGGGSGRTNADGVYHTKTTGINFKKPVYVSAKKGNDQNIMYYYKGRQSASPWQFGFTGSSRTVPDSGNGAVFTERGVYRPGEKVYLKGYIDQTFNRSFNNVSLVITDSRGENVVDRTVSVGSYASFDYSFNLSEEAAVGAYNVQVTGRNLEINWKFNVEEYRVPTFFVELDAREKETLDNERLNIDVLSEYYKGGALGGRHLEWKVTYTNVPFTSEIYSNYSFQTRRDIDSVSYYTQGSDSLAEDGSYSFSFKPRADVHRGRQLYTVEGVVEDLDNQAYSGYFSQYVHPSDRYIGIKAPPNSVYGVGERISVPYILLDTDGNVMEGQEVKVELEALEYHSYREMWDYYFDDYWYWDMDGYDSEEDYFYDYITRQFNREVTKVDKEDVIISSAVPRKYEVIPQKPGRYRLKFSSRGSNGATVVNYFTFVAGGEGYYSWARFDAEEIPLIQDKSVYQVGDVAKLMAESPYEKAKVLLTVERDGIISHQVREINSTTPIIELPITEDFVSNVFVSAVLIKGRENYDTDSLGYQTGAPGLKIGYAELLVEPDKKELDITVLHDASYSPSSSVSVPIRVIDADGKPVEAEIAVMVVDEAVLDLTAYKTPDLIPLIYKRKPLGVWTNSSVLNLEHSRRERQERLFYGGGGGDEGDYGGEGDNGKKPFIMERDFFKSTPYFNPSVITNKNGMAEISFVTPENLTSFRVMAVAVDKKNRFGSSESEFKVNLPLMVEPVSPRFLYVGDTAYLEAMVFNNTSKSGTVNLTVEVEGATPKNSALLKQSKTVAAGATAMFPFPVQAMNEAELVVHYQVEMQGFADRVEKRIPIYEPIIRINKTISNFSDNGTISLTTPMPGTLIKGTFEGDLTISEGPLYAVTKAARYLMRYPHGCIEQTISRLYPQIVLSDLLSEMGKPITSMQLDHFSGQGLERLSSFKTSSGALAYWPGNTNPHVLGSAMAGNILAEADSQGRQIDQNMKSSLIRYYQSVIRKTLAKEPESYSDPDVNVGAYLVYTLFHLGENAENHLSYYLAREEDMSVFGLSYLAMAEMEKGDNTNQERLTEILDEIKSRITITDEGFVTLRDYKYSSWYFGSRTRSTGAALLAFSRAKQDKELAIALLRTLLKYRWRNTQDNLYALLGIRELIDFVQVFPPDGGPTVTVNGTDYPKSVFNMIQSGLRKITLNEELLGFPYGEGFDLDVDISNVSDLAYADLNLRFLGYPDDVILPPYSNKMSIKRSYTDVNGTELNGKEFKAGDIVIVTLEVEAGIVNYRTWARYLAVTNPIPAGFEVMNQAFANTQKIDLGRNSNNHISVSYSEIRDNMVGFYMDEGYVYRNYTFKFVMRATRPGRYFAPHARAEFMYEPDVNGLSGASYITITE